MAEASLMTTEASIRVLLVDDHSLVRAGMAHGLSTLADIDVVGQASSGEEGIELARTLCPDVVLMDLRMPGIGGYEAARRINAAHDDCVVIAVTAVDDEPDFRLCRSGIAACVVKSADPAELEQVIRSECIAQRENPGRSLDIGVAEPVSDSPFASLTGREMQLVYCGIRGMTPQQTADQLKLSVKSVYTYRYRLYAKLGVKNEVEMLNLANRHGIQPV